MGLFSSKTLCRIFSEPCITCIQIFMVVIGLFQSCFPKIKGLSDPTLFVTPCLSIVIWIFDLSFLWLALFFLYIYILGWFTRKDMKWLDLEQRKPAGIVKLWCNFKQTSIIRGVCRILYWYSPLNLYLIIIVDHQD